MGERGIAAVCICALALLLTGCGSDSSSETAAGLRKAEFVERAEAVCKKAKNEIIQKNFAQIRKLADDPKAREKFEYEVVEETVVPALEHEVEQLEALGAAPGNSAQIEQMLKLVEGAIAEAKTEPETYVSGADYRWGSEHYGKAHRLAVAYGIENCPMDE